MQILVDASVFLLWVLSILAVLWTLGRALRHLLRRQKPEVGDCSTNK